MINTYINVSEDTLRRNNMAFVRIVNIVDDNGTVFADAQAFEDEHGPMGIDNWEYVSEGTMTLNAEGTGVQTVLTYDDEAKHDAHLASDAENFNKYAGVTFTLVSAE
jgi:hypothetical protein|tara:strand:- start:784 stop:1104 length:321 start_codon:yes stop_codon:yes gene_type:complete